MTVCRSLDVDGTFKTPKNRAAKRTLRLTPQVLDTLKAHKVRQNEERLQAGSRWQDHNLVFPNTVGRPMNAGNLYRRDFQLLLKRAGLADEGFTIHDMRHTFATLMLRNRADLNTVSRMLGHSSVKITLDVYGHVVPGMQKEALKSLDELF